MATRARRIDDMDPDVAALWAAEIARRAAEVDADPAVTMTLAAYRAHVAQRRLSRS